MRQAQLDPADPDLTGHAVRDSSSASTMFAVADEVGHEAARRLPRRARAASLLGDAGVVHHDDAVGDRQRLPWSWVT